MSEPVPGTEALSSVVDTLARAQALERHVAAERFWVVCVPDEGEATCAEFATIEETVAALRSWHGQALQCFVICGQRWHISQGPQRHLLPPPLSPLEPIQLFVQLDALGPDPSGRMDSFDTEAPTQEPPANY